MKDPITFLLPSASDFGEITDAVIFMGRAARLAKKALQRLANPLTGIRVHLSYARSPHAKRRSRKLWAGGIKR